MLMGWIMDLFNFKYLFWQNPSSRAITSSEWERVRGVRERQQKEGQERKVQERERQEREERESRRAFNKCLVLIVVLVKSVSKKELLRQFQHLEQQDAQFMVDFIDKVLSEYDFEDDERKRILCLLSEVAQSYQVFPGRFVLENVQCDLEKPVNSGGSGSIYKGTFESQVICVKTVRETAALDLKIHAGELVLWANMKHTNVQPFYGAYISDTARVCLVSPWMENGSLNDYLQRFPGCRRIPLLLDTVSGLGHLHGMDFVHADLKAKNVLVSLAGRAVLADFGLSRVSMTTSDVTTFSGNTPGTTKWMAPELFDAERGRLPTKKSDMWAFGCLCYEVITDRQPFEEYALSAQVIAALMRGERPGRRVSRSEDEWKVVWESVIEKCWVPEPKGRQSAADARRVIEALKAKDDRPPAEPDDFSDRKRGCDIKIDFSRVLGTLEQVQRVLGPRVNQNLDGDVDASSKGEVPSQTDTVHKARALYDYDADPEDPNEISLTMGEVLDVLNNSGMWWLARKADGKVGMAKASCLSTAEFIDPTINNADSSTVTEVSCKACALHAYVTSTGVPNSLSLDKDEVVDVVDKSAPVFWIARKADGMIGMVPCCYLSTADPVDPTKSTVTPDGTSKKARVLYNYEADTNDPNEISLVLGEILDVLNNPGTWWLARKADGTVGMTKASCLSTVEFTDSTVKNASANAGTEVPCKARALQACMAHPGVLGSFSLTKHEVLDVLDKNAPIWWIARKEDGTVGMVPCCYLSIVDPIDSTDRAVAPDDTLHKARSLYDHETDPEDPNEIPLTLGEVLDVLNKSGTWWLVRKADEKIGMAKASSLSTVEFIDPDPGSSVEVPCKARALHTYVTSSGVPNSLPLVKDEVLDILDKSASIFWIARKEDGTVGMVPGCYFSLVDPIESTNSTVAPTDTLRQARVLYSYEASADDPNEVTLIMGEVLDILNNVGLWWLVRKADGTVGMAKASCLSTAEFIDPTVNNANTSTGTEVPCKARALHAYVAHRGVLNSLSFAKDEVLDVVDKSAPNWWIARKVDGTVGMVYSSSLSFI